jgi:pimeloyl-ACP methyl ester carboxylesterase
MILTADCAAFDVIQTGGGCDLVLFHFLLTDRTVLDGLVPALARRRRVTLVNLPGFGGFVSIALAARHGRLFDRLVLVDTAAAFPEPAKAPLRGMAERALRDGMSAVVDTALRRMFAEGFIVAHPEVVRERAAGIAGAALVEIADCAHCPPLETPTEFLAAVQAFLDAP